jgi:hypothetical protein
VALVEGNDRSWLAENVLAECAEAGEKDDEDAADAQARARWLQRSASAYQVLVWERGACQHASHLRSWCLTSPFS